MTFTSTLVDRTAKFLENRLSRRNFINRSAFVGSAVAVGAGLDLALKPGTAYGQICECGNAGCGCGSTCCAGFSEFCCAVTGYNYCPGNTVMGGWWLAENSSYCGGPRYYMDCNATCKCDAGCGSFCDPGCDGTNCGCGPQGCNSYLTGCLQFRYGQCNQNVACIGRIVCRVVACVPPWQVDPSCTTALAIDNATAEQNEPCWTPAPPTPPTTGEAMPVSPTVMFPAGQLNVFQVAGGILWHKTNWQGAWNNENVGAASGVNPNFPNQIPQVAVIGGQIMVTVEDNNSRVWYFAHSTTGGWGVNELP
jgi:hypothetical protein